MITGTLLYAQLYVLTLMMPVIGAIVDGFDWMRKAVGYTLDYIRDKFNAIGGDTFMTSMAGVWAWLKSSAMSAWI